RAGDAERTDVAARQRRARHRPADGAPPHLPAALRIESLDDVAFARGEEERALRIVWIAPEERLCVKVAVDAGIEGIVELDRRRVLPSQRRDDKIAAARRIAVIGEDRFLLRLGLRAQARDQE